MIIYFAIFILAMGVSCLGGILARQSRVLEMDMTYVYVYVLDN